MLGPELGDAEWHKSRWRSSPAPGQAQVLLVVGMKGILER